jgi:nucleotide-binding universal stress UspA family protein
LHNILLPLDRSVLAECVLPHAVAVATALGAQVTLLHAMQPPAAGEHGGPVDPLEWRVRRMEAETYLKDVQARLEAAGVTPDCHVVDGEGAEQIVKYARENQVDLVMLSSHGQSGLSGWNVSSIAQKVILRAYTSVMVVRAYQPVVPELTGVHYERVLVPLDGSTRAESALALVADLGRSHRSHVLIAHVVSRPELPARTPPSAEDNELIERVVERNRAEAVRYLEDVRGRLPDLDVETRLIVANQPETALHQLAEQEGADLVLMTAHGYTGDPSWPYGSVVVSFLAYGLAPVLIVQDVPHDQAQLTHAELALQRLGRR